MRRMLVLAAACLAADAVAETIVVNNTADSGEGSLRQALTDANGRPGLDRIIFETLPQQPFSIRALTALPEITDPVEIDGRTAAGFSGTPIVEVHGGNRDMAHGLKFVAGSNGSSVYGLALHSFGGNNPSHAVWAYESGGHTFSGLRVGTNPPGDTNLRNRGDGVRFENSANNILENSLVSGNRRFGIHLIGAAAFGNTIRDCLVGLNYAGTAAIGNFNAGIGIEDAPGAAIRNSTISGNSGPQIDITGTGARGTVIAGNRIGVKADALAFGLTPSTAHGVRIDDAGETVIGGPAASDRNVIGNVTFGITLSGAGAAGTRIFNNYIGVDGTGGAPAPNQTGIYLGELSSGTIIGGATAGSLNVISANLQHGISISNSSGNQILGNYIGTDVTGMIDLGNTTAGAQGSGVSVAAFTGVAENNVIGGEADGAGNLISGNNDDGIVVAGLNCRNTIIRGNRIGSNANNSALLGNENAAVSVLGANGTRILNNLVVGNGGGASPWPSLYVGGTFGGFGDAAIGTEATGNTIGFGGAAGIAFLFPTVAGENDFFEVPGLWVDVGNDGPTTPAPTAAQLTIERVTGDPLQVTGSLVGRPNCAYTISAYVERPVGEPRDLEEWVRALARSGDDSTLFLDKFTVTTDASGLASFDNRPLQGFVFPGEKVRFQVTGACEAESQEFSPHHTPLFTPGSVFEMADSIISILESDGFVMARIQRVGDLSQPASVQLRVLVPGETTPWVDPAEGTVTPALPTVEFDINEAFEEVRIPIVNDSVFNGTRRFDLALENPHNATLGADKAFGFVRDDDIPPFRVAVQRNPAGGFDLLTEPADAPIGFEMSDSPAMNSNLRIIGYTTITVGDFGEQMEVPTFFRGFADRPMGLWDVDIFGMDGMPLPSDFKLRVGRGGMDLPSDGFVAGVPQGVVDLVVEKSVTVQDTTTGQNATLVIPMFLPVPTRGDAKEEVSMRLNLQADTSPLTATARQKSWAAAAVGMLSGVQAVMLTGGTFGYAEGDATIRVRGPGVDRTLAEGEEHFTFAPAEAGTYFVETIFGDSVESVTVTVP